MIKRNCYDEKPLCRVFLVASLYAGNVYAQPAAVKKIIEIGTTDNRVMHQLDVLTNRFGGRPIGSDAYDNAAEWMLREFRSWGIEAHLEEAGELPVGLTVVHGSDALSGATNR